MVIRCLPPPHDTSYQGGLNKSMTILIPVYESKLRQGLKTLGNRGGGRPALHSPGNQVTRSPRVGSEGGTWRVEHRE